MATMAALPPHIIESILLRLPVKSLLRSKCVCKAWCSLISHPQFSKIHLQHPQTQARTRLCIIDNEERGHDNAMVVRLSTTDCETIGDDTGGSLSYDYLTDIENLTYHAQFLDSCDGLFCLIDALDNIFLWNPSTRQYSQLPPVPSSSRYDISFYGFGYDSSADDYKIVGVFDTGYDSENWIDVFSLKSYAWRRIQETHHAKLVCTKGIVLHGAVHWVGSSSDDRDEYYYPIIMAFDFEKEQFREIAMPIDHNLLDVRLKVIEGCLCVYNKEDPSEKWVMKKYGVEASWTQMASPSPSPSPYGTENNFNEEFKCQLLDFLNNQHLFLINNEKVVLWDDKENTEKDVMPYGKWLEYCEANLFVETLLSPHPLLSLRSDQKKEKKRGE